ncbi:hypothetical protein KJ671_02315 [Patescibacteria group bacterium]|nr:hypothetical protein [Patescibacteria group bacterium]
MEKIKLLLIIFYEYKSSRIELTIAVKTINAPLKKVIEKLDRESKEIYWGDCFEGIRIEWTAYYKNFVLDRGTIDIL